MNIIGNILWLIFGGLIIAVEYFVTGLILCCTIIGIPFGWQAIKIGMLSLYPFGYRSVAVGSDGKYLTTTMNIIWILIGGLWIALTHLVFGILLCITIIGIPFGRQHFKLMSLALTPFGKNIIPNQ